MLLGRMIKLKKCKIFEFEDSSANVRIRADKVTNVVQSNAKATEGHKISFKIVK